MKHYKIINNSIQNNQILQNGGGGLNILSYNVSWEAMTSTTTGNMKLCKSDGLGGGICKTNILDNISSNLKKYKPDIACFQEASDYEDIVDLFDNSIYENFVNMSDKELMLTLWNKKKFNLVKSFYGEFEEGRPFAIIILKQKNKNIALINLHAGHKINTQTSIFEILNNFIKTNITYSIKKSITRVIMSGDFNRDVYEDENSNYTIKFIDEFELKRSSNNKNTCCSPLGYGHKFNYDHVLDSKAAMVKKIVGNSLKSYKYPASDHVLIVVNIK